MSTRLSALLCPVEREKERKRGRKTGLCELRTEAEKTVEHGAYNTEKRGASSGQKNNNPTLLPK